MFGGINSSHYLINSNNAQVKPASNMIYGNIGFNAEIPLKPNLFLVPGFMYSVSGINYSYISDPVYVGPGTGDYYLHFTGTHHIVLNNLLFQCDLKYKFNLFSQYKFFLDGGLAYSASGGGYIERDGQINKSYIQTGEIVIEEDYKVDGLFDKDKKNILTFSKSAVIISIGAGLQVNNLGIFSSLTNTTQFGVFYDIGLNNAVTYENGGYINSAKSRVLRFSIIYYFENRQ